MSKRWKEQEQRIAHLLGLRRNVNSWKAAPDAEVEWLVVEVKDRKRFPSWIESALLKVQAQANEGQLGIAVLTGPTASRDLVIMDLNDFRDWFVERGELPRGK
mgnify:FL=1